ncbi:type II and III secretion system protein family protein [Sphingomonas sp. LaA6.9]|uniref:type II and III secretion system protein family protein n=1 Tax=Sphingomonas sp. LaA6.9 TaxID=2919914 RepID=UPI001F4F4B52|nr:type II and III secretion system protein family protein [Sphingomonas sp. LaA6.9]MCJ8155931.1 pilus assembly protein N-terminal domain-containing protein [Sphingomonas sp. LaA6.9]
MAFMTKTKKRSLECALAAALTMGMAIATAAPLGAAPGGASQPSATVNLSTGRGTLVNLASPMSDLFVADSNIADVQVRSPTQLYIFAKGPGETTLYATSRGGKVVYAANVRVGTNFGTVDSMLQLAMPDAEIRATPMNGLVLLTGTVANPDDVAEAERLAQAFVGANTQVVTRLRTATPLQVNLQVRIAEVSRDFMKSVGVNLLATDGNFFFTQGRADAITVDPNTGNVTVKGTGIGSTMGIIDRFLGMDIQAALDLAETDGLVSTLANPNLTALSGETASFLAGGEIPIPISEGLGSISIEYKQYGVSLAFTPIVLADGRISMRVRPEVSQLSDAGSVRLEGFTIPGITTRRAETTVELGSGQSFMIGGLLSSNHNNSVDKTPFLGDLPVLGALFRSKRFKRSESELMIVVTPYLVKPVSANQIALPTDGYRGTNDAETFLLGQTFEGTSGAKRPAPKSAAPRTVEPGMTPHDPSAALPAPGNRGPAPLAPAPERVAVAPAQGKSDGAAAAPGFSFD